MLIQNYERRTDNEPRPDLLHGPGLQATPVLRPLRRALPPVIPGVHDEPDGRYETGLQTLQGDTAQQ